MRGSDFILESVQLLYYKCHKWTCWSYIDSPDWIKKKKATTINRKNIDDTCFQYAVTVTLNYKRIKWNPESFILHYIISYYILNNYNWKGINYLSKIDDWKTFGNFNLTIALNILYIKEKEIYPAYIWKHNWTCEKQIILLKIPIEE